eukprot:8989614-Alexandrium_andersonii.AAC.1
MSASLVGSEMCIRDSRVGAAVAAPDPLVPDPQALVFELRAEAWGYWPPCATTAHALDELYALCCRPSSELA